MKHNRLFKNNKNKYSLIGFGVLLCCLMFGSSLYAQNQTIIVNGTVKSNTGEPLTGVAVKTVNQNNMTITDIDGNYKLRNVKQNDKLEFSYVGMASQIIDVDGRSTIDVILNENIEELENVVVIGYGTAKKSSLTGAVSKISSEKLQTQIATNVTSALQGRIPGVSITRSTGTPGGKINVNVRGITSLRAVEPLYIIDGVYGDINLIDPADISSIEVLKDASAAAIYGSRAANGVILITSKSGIKETPSKLSVSYYGGVQQIAKKLPLLNATQWIDFLKQNGQNIPDVPLYTGGSGTNWQDEVYRVAALQKANIGITGGSKTSTYNVSTGYIKQEGIRINTDYEAFNTRIKSDFSLFNNRLKVGESLIVKLEKNKGDTFDALLTTNPLLMIPMVPVYDESNLGGYASTPSSARNMANPVGISMLITPKIEHFNLLFNSYAELEIISGLKYKLNFGYSNSYSRAHNYSQAYDLGSEFKVDKPRLEESNGFSDYWLLEHTFNYNKQIEKHNISALVGYSAQKNRTRGFSFMARDLPIGYEVINATKPEFRTLNGGDLYESAIISSFARLIYSFDNRYLLSATVRRDGSSKFAPGHRYGTFPSVSVGWNIHNEEFAAPMIDIVNNLKIRASYGKLGNQEVGNYLTQSTAVMGMNYVLGDNTWWLGQNTNMKWTSPENLTWEETGTFNLGLDASFLNNKLDFSLDLFTQKTKNVLLQINMPPSGGLIGMPFYNAADIKNRGIELGLNFRNKAGDFYYELGANFSSISNKVSSINMNKDQEFDGFNPWREGVITKVKEGDPIGSFYLIKTDGIFNSQEEIDNYKDASGNKIQPNAVPGDIRFIDYNADGKIDDNDKQFAGSPFPKFNYGIRTLLGWKDLDITLFFDGVAGNKLFNYPRSRMETVKELTNYSDDVLRSWTEDNHSDIPRFTKDDPNKNSRINSNRWLENGSFFRLKNLELGYNLPKSLLMKTNVISKGRLFFSAENLFVLTKYKGYSPDLGVVEDSGSNTNIPALTRGTDVGRYPSARTFTFGIQVTF